MWKQITRWLQPSDAKSDEATPSSPVLAIDDAVFFTDNCVIAELKNTLAHVIRRRIYRFSQDIIYNYSIKTTQGREYSITISDNSSAPYIGVSRELSSAQQRVWFDPDALGFFLEKTSAQTLKCHAKEAIDLAWSAQHYKKSVDLIYGQIANFDKVNAIPVGLTYSMLLDADQQKAIEIEQYEEHGLIRMYATMFMPYSSIQLGDEIPPDAVIKHTPSAQKNAPEEAVFAPPLKASSPPVKDTPPPIKGSSPNSKTADDKKKLTDHTASSGAQILPMREAFEALSRELTNSENASDTHVQNGHAPTFTDDDKQPEPHETPEEPQAVKKIFKNDFRRLDIAEKITDNTQWESGEGAPLPNFLLAPKNAQDQAPLDLFQQIFETNPNQVVCDPQSAAFLSDQAQHQGLSVQELIREKIGLSDKKDSLVSIDLPLSAEDYKKLAMRYHIRPDKKEAIRKRMSEELSDFFIKN
jgi:hypothetical protein